MRALLPAAGLLLAACGGPAPEPSVQVVGLDGLRAELPRALGKGALVNLWAMW